jgi:hypothetical protein
MYRWLTLAKQPLSGTGRTSVRDGESKKTAQRSQGFIGIHPEAIQV